jgi:hypothetical protein
MLRLVALSLCAVLACAAGVGQAPSSRIPVATPKDAANSRWKVATVPQLRKGVDAWPLVQSPDVPAAKRVNANLTRLNKRLANALRECDASYQEWAKDAGKHAKSDDSASGQWERQVQVTMSGPRYLSLVASDSYFCGGAHPEDQTIAMVFDMTTGAPVNWLAHIAKSAGASSFAGSLSGGTAVGALTLRGLQALATANAEEDCKGEFDDPQPFLIWPDAKNGVLVAEPFGLAHAVARCASDTLLTIEQARKLGFDDSVLNAIDEAHRSASKR